MTEAVLSRVRELTGIRLPDTLREAVMEYVAETARAAGLPVPVYLERLPADREALDAFIERITIGETYFFRDEKQFRVLETRLFPEFRERGRRSLRLWSAACSTGEEAVSLALLAGRFCADGALDDYSVYATDLNRQSLESLGRGLFRAGSLRADGSGYHRLLEPHLSRPDPLTLRLDPVITARVQTFTLNLAGCDYRTVPDDLDIIFLRNVLIYLDPDLRQLILDALLKKLRTGGCIFLAASEVPLFVHRELALREADGVFFLQKVTPNSERHTKPKGSARADTDWSQKAETPPRLRSAPAPRAKARTETLEATREIEVWQRCFNLINDGQGDAARALLQGCPAGAMASFLRGYGCMCEGSTELAVKAFTDALEADPHFWPARYHRAVLETQGEARQARRDFTRAGDDIERYIERGRDDFDFLLEGFNSRYFRDICEKWANKLALTGDTHGHR